MSPINKKLFEGSLRQVRRELKSRGFGKKKIMQIKVSRTLVPSIKKMGYFYDGEIFVPVLQPKGEVRDTIRHEYGHAILALYPKIRVSPGFVSFGNSIDDKDYVNKYAMRDTDEDFCETFAMYLKHGGKRPKKYSSPRLRKKWSFIASLRSRSS